MKRKGKKVVGMVLMVAMIMVMTVPAQAARSNSFFRLYNGYYYSGTLDILETGAWRAVRATITSEAQISNEMSDSVSLNGPVFDSAGITLEYLDAQKWATSNVTSASDIVENSNLQGAEVDYHAGYYLSSPVVKTLSVNR